MYAIRDEYAPRFGRQILTLWSGGFASDFEGYGYELPGHNGFMIKFPWWSASVRVECPSPRTDENFEAVDAAINAALDGVNA